MSDSSTEAVERIAASVAASVAGLWAGGLLALGAIAAPVVFSETPAPFSGNAMGQAFGRFDRVALIFSGLLLACEFTRTWMAEGGGKSTGARVRRTATMLLAAAAVYLAVVITPRIRTMHRDGVSRGVGEAGALMEALHRQATWAGKGITFLCIALVFLHIMTLRKPLPASISSALGPLPPGGALPRIDESDAP